ncbi:DNA-directed RNA polymerase subunit beta [Schlesneria paludicola]|uniref:DNA-directed RNA polymerase subunit beta n=1 Tax=Schlesneria paludicola TaxID=360056 RepID=UPI00029B211B|nr:DNA-directed RNA polymerase subunit beta [Schlesneria paludicola]
MPIPATRVVQTNEIRNYGSIQGTFEISDLTKIQTDSYVRFLQLEADARERKDEGLEAILREVFPIESYDGKYRLEYIKYELGKPRYTQLECRQLRLTFGRPFRIWLRLVKEQPIEEEVYLGDMPIMIGGGEFIINGAERVVVSQLHRSPGVDFVQGAEPGERKQFSCRVIPERGSWIEIVISKRDTLGVRIDQSGKFSAMTFLRAMNPEYGSSAALVKLFYKTATVKFGKDDVYASLLGKYAADEIVYPAKHEKVGEIIVELGHVITKSAVEEIRTSGLKSVDIIEEMDDALALSSILEDPTVTHEDALLRIYQRLRPGNPPQLEKAIELFNEKFFDANRYRLGRVGRFRINRKFDQDVPDTEMTLKAEDIVNSIRYVIKLRIGDSVAHVDDIDNLGNRRLRTIDELAAEEIRKGFLKLRRTVQERMQMKDVEEMSPRTLVNPKSVSAAIEYFFGRGELSQVVDQTNPLATLTHERRLSALGPGGLNRKRAGFEVRDVHISHYGRICPIETPEGTNIGLISSLSIFAKVDDYGFLITPYRSVVERKVSEEVKWLRADEESRVFIAPADTTVRDGKIADDRVMARFHNDVVWIAATDVHYIDVSPCQMVGVSAGLIPFLEHDDANRALMGSNMQRQGVPLLVAESPLVGTGLESAVAESSGMVLRAEKSGKITYVDADRIELEGKSFPLRKYTGLNERTCLNQRPIVKVGQRVKKGEILCDSAATSKGELALGRNVLVAFMSFDGFNFEDAIILSERLVKEDVYTSIHIDEFDVEVRETKLGREEFTRDIPNVSEKALRHLDEEGIVKIGTYVEPGDILVGKVSPKAKTELTPEEKLLHAIFGRAGEDVKNESLEVPSGTEGIVIHTEKFSRRMSLSEGDRKKFEADLKKVEDSGNEAVAAAFREFLKEFEKALEKKLTDDDGRDIRTIADDKFVATYAENFLGKFETLDIKSPQKRSECKKVIKEQWTPVEDAIDSRDRKLNTMKRGDELPSGVLQMVKVYVASKRQISVGDKMAGRHGNKGVISKILPEEDMPFLADGTPVDIILNPLGVPSRMNVGQILETHLGWAAAKLGFKVRSPVFDSPSEDTVRALLVEAGLPEDGKAQLHDGRTGEPFEQKTTVGYIYMLKLHHLVEDKVHARATGPYSLITQQPLGGKARFGGQRFGEMEVWALEAYGAAYILQELLTVKSDDVEGRTKIYESMVKGENTLEAGTPASFEVLNNEIRGLCLNMQLEKSPT